MMTTPSQEQARKDFDHEEVELILFLHEQHPELSIEDVLHAVTDVMHEKYKKLLLPPTTWQLSTHL